MACAQSGSLSSLGAGRKKLILRLSGPRRPLRVSTPTALCLIEKPRGQHGGVPGQLLFRSSHIPKLPSGLGCYCDSLHLFFEASRLTDVIHPPHTYNFMCRFKKEGKGKGHRKQEGKVKLSFLTLSQGISRTFCSQCHMLISVWVRAADLEELEMNKANLFCM